MWQSVLSEETMALGEALAARAAAERAKGVTVYPPQDQTFRALDITPPEQVSVCIIGQDPYHGTGQANGLAFSVNPDIQIPRSLKNIFKELQNDIGCPPPRSGDLTPWAEQGVLLLNTVLTVESGEANSHAKWGWQEFVLGVVKACTELPQPIVFVLWGRSARAFVELLMIPETPGPTNKVKIWSSHPSPLGASKGSNTCPAFLGSKPFSKTNKLLTEMGAKAIDWQL